LVEKEKKDGIVERNQPPEKVRRPASNLPLTTPLRKGAATPSLE